MADKATGEVAGKATGEMVASTKKNAESNGQSNKSTRDSGSCSCRGSCETQARSASSTCAAEPGHAGGVARLGHALGGRGEARMGDVRCLVASARAMRSLYVVLARSAKQLA